MDHYTAMQDSSDQSELYFRTDTHWNELGGARAIQQIAFAWLGKQIDLPTRGTGSETSVDTDLRTGMLRLRMTESVEVFPNYWENTYRQQIGPGISDAVILHDSFYKRIIAPLNDLFPDGQFYDLNHPDTAATRAAIAARPSYLLVNSVERRFIPRLFNQNYSWNSPLGMGLIDANERASADCVFEPVSNSELKFANMTPGEEANSFITERDPRIFVELNRSGERPCVRIHFETSAQGYSQLFLPTDANGSVREGMSIRFYDKQTAQREIQLVLPPSFAATIIRFDPDPGQSNIKNLRVAIGHVH